jgi:glutamine amidotransferase
MQWNRLDRVDGPGPGTPPGGTPLRTDAGLLAGVPDQAWVYFVHSYAPELSPDTSSTCAYGGPVTASAERGAVWGTQFHPEKSGVVGLGILSNYVGAVNDGRR